MDLGFDCHRLCGVPLKREKLDIWILKLMHISLRKKIKNIPQSPGVYIFKDATGGILYIGKAASLKNRISSYFSGRNENRPVFYAIDKIEKIEVRKTDSVLEALILESNLIKEYQPKYNIDLRDDKSFSYAVITKEEFPRIIILRKTEFKNNKNVIRYAFGPYTSKKQLETAIKIIRKIFPYHSDKHKTERGCLDYQIGLCPGPYVGAITKADYLKNIRNIRIIFEGKKKILVGNLEREMREFAKKREFEKAADIRNKIFALQHIQDIALISRDMTEKTKTEKNISQTSNLKPQIRIEAYDISDISGQYAVGGMVVFKNGEPEKSQYRKFKIKTVQNADDVGMMREVLLRRFDNDWSHPDLILLDGGLGHLNMGKKIIKTFGLDIPVLAVAKGSDRKNLDLRFEKENGLIDNVLHDKSLIKRIMDEAHRFAISYHRKVRRKNFTK